MFNGKYYETDGCKVISKKTEEVVCTGTTAGWADTIALLLNDADRHAYGDDDKRTPDQQKSDEINRWRHD